MADTRTVDIPPARPEEDTTRPPGPGWDEAERLAALASYGILDTPAEPAFDDLVQVVAHACAAPVAAVNLIAQGRQWSKAERGLGVREAPLDHSICARTMLRPGPTVVPDLALHPRFACNPLVTGPHRLRFYAGAPLLAPRGLPMGTLCVFDRAPRPDGLSPEQASALRTLAHQVMAQMELRRAAADRDRVQERAWLYRALLDQSSDFIGLAAPDGRGIYLNEAGRRMVGLPAAGETPPEPGGRTGRLGVLDFFLPEDRPFVEEVVLPAMRREGRWAGEYRFRRFGADGAVPVHYTQFGIQGPGGQDLAIAAVARDTTRERRAREELERRVAERTAELAEANAALRAEAAERERAEASLRQAQKMEAVGQLTGGIAHDFNNLMTVVLGGLEAIGRQVPALPDGPASARIRRSCALALTGVQRAAALTQRLLAFSRRQPLDPRPVDANELVQGMAELLRRTLGESVELRTRLAPGLWPALADPNGLENAILNLAVNARDAMSGVLGRSSPNDPLGTTSGGPPGPTPGGGTLLVETGNVWLDEGFAAREAEAVEPGEYVLILVADDGAGMDGDTLARAFEPFYTTKDVGQGTGLGLSQVYGFVRQSGGHVRLYSEPGQGTTVKLYLPRQPAGGGEPDPAPRPRDSAARARGELVLVVEDDPDLRAYSTDALRELGYRVLDAADGQAALDVLEANPDVALLFADVGLPGGMTGPGLAGEAGRRRPGLRVLYTTGYARSGIGLRAGPGGGPDGAAGLVSKPFAFADLAARVRAALDGAG